MYDSPLSGRSTSFLLALYPSFLLNMPRHESGVLFIYYVVTMACMLLHKTRLIYNLLVARGLVIQ